MKISYATDVGKVRSENQDSVFVHSFSKTVALLIVADGMGGYEGGKLASSMAIDHISNRIISDYHQNMNEEEIKELLQMSVGDANRTIYEAARRDKRLEGMGTTVVVAILAGNTLYTANIGDSRSYVFNGESLKQITTDHSLVNDLLKRGLISASEADNHPQRNVITRAVGTDIKTEVDIFVTDLNKGETVLMCSDGLYSMVHDKEIEKILSKKTGNRAQKLIDLANKNGGRDNISVVCAQVTEEVK